MTNALLAPLHTAPSLDRRLAAAWDGHDHWLLVFEASQGDRPGATALWRSQDAKTYEAVCNGAAVCPPGKDLYLARLVATGPGELHLFSEGSEDGAPAFHARFDGKRFAPVKAPPFAWHHASRIEVDPKRRTLLAAGNPEQGGLFELSSGAWKRVGDLLPSESSEVSLVWDGARAAVVILESGEKWGRFSSARSWDGKTLGQLPTPDIQLVGGRWEMGVRGGPHPVDGRAVLVGAQGLGAWKLGKKAFEKLEAGDDEIHLSGGGDLTCAPGAFRLWGVSLYGERPGSQCILWDGKTWERLGPAVPGWQGEADQSGRLEAFETGSVAHRDAEGLDWEYIYEAKKGDAQRSDSSVVWDAANQRLLRMGGVKPPYDKTIISRETWAWAKKGGWKQLATKGQPVARSRGLAVMSGAEVILADGENPTSRKGERVRITEHFDGTRWVAFKDSFRAGKTDRIEGLWVDEKTGAVFAVSKKGIDAQLWSYRGAGQWQLGQTLSVSAEAGLEKMTFAFDPRQRRLVAKGTLHDPWCTEGIFAAPLGPWLDSLPSPQGGAAKPSSGATSTPRAPAKAAPATATSRWLIYREEGLGKYWFASLDGKKWTARWGKRGTEGQTKTWSLATADQARAEYQKTVGKKLDEGYVDSDRGEKIALLASRPAFAMAVTGKPAADRIGGPAPVDPPVCKGCKAPMEFIALFAGDAERLPLPGKAKALAIFMCDSGGSCKTWAPDSGANAAILLDRLPPAASKGQGVRFKATTEIDLQAEGLEEEESPGGSKLGGFPTWVQSVEIPRRPRCKAAMTFALQLEADDAGANFGDAGVGYAFTCSHGARFLWQCA